MGQFGVESVPGAGGGGAVEAGVGHGLGIRGAPGVFLAEDDLAAVPRRALGLPGRGGPAQDAVRPHPGQDPDRQIPQEVGQAGCVVSGVRDDEDVQVAGLPLAGRDEPLDEFTQLPGGDGGGVVPGQSRGAVHELRPGSSAQMTEYGQPGTGMWWSLPRP